MCSFGNQLESCDSKLYNRELSRNQELLQRAPTEPTESKRQCLAQLNTNITAAAASIASNTPTRVNKPIVIDAGAKQNLLDDYKTTSHQTPRPQSPIINRNSMNTSSFYSRENKTAKVLELLDVKNDSSPILSERSSNKNTCSSPVASKRKRDYDHDNLANVAQQTKLTNSRFASISKTYADKKKTSNEKFSSSSVYDIENQENQEKSPVKTWNRNNSMNNKECNKG